MTHPETHLVTLENGPRPAGRSDRCFYCDVAVNYPHAKDCVCRKRTVLIEARVQYVVDVPEDWPVEQIESHRNESSWCASNDVALIQGRIDPPEGCPCFNLEFAFIREASAVDDIQFGIGAIAP